MIHLTKILIVLGLALAAMPSRAQVLIPQDRGFVGLTAGYTSTSHLNGRLGFGAEGGLAFTNGWTGSLFFLSSKADHEGVDVQVVHYGLGADYRLTNVLNGLTAGLRLGAGTLDPDAGDAQNGFAIGPAISYDRMVSDAFSVGAEAQLLWTKWDDNETTTFFMLTGKYWL